MDLQTKGLRIGVDARPLAFPGTGNATYLHGMLRHLPELRPSDEWFLFSHRPLHQDFLHLLNRPGISLHVKRGLPGPLWLNLYLPGLLKEYGCDVFWATLAMLPLFFSWRFSKTSLVNFHDLNAFVYPETMEFWNRWQHRLLDASNLRNAGRIVCLSHTTKADILRFFPKTEPERLAVVYPGCEISGGAEREPAQPVGKLKHFILSVGTIEPRKNQATLVEAYLQARKEVGFREKFGRKNTNSLLPLVLVGRKGWGDESLYNRLSSGELEASGIFLLADASNEELKWCYRQAAFLACPSLHEGFGLPVIEGLLYEKPLLLSDIPIFREVGQGAKFIPPTDKDAWKRALLSYSQLFFKQELRAPSFDRQTYRWRAKALELASVLGEGAGRMG